MVKDVLREIKAKWFQFIAILLITALGVGFYVGIQVTGYDMRYTADVYMESSDALDLEYRHSLGIDKEMLQALHGFTGGKAYGIYDTDAFIQVKGNDGVARVIESTKFTEKDLVLTEGVMARNPLEVVVDDQMRHHFLLEIGDTIKLKNNDIFEESELKIVGFAKSNLYMNLERGSTTLGSGSVLGFIYPSGLEHKHEVYTAVRFEKIDVDASIEKLESNESTLSHERFERIVKNDRLDLEEAQQNLDELKSQTLAEFSTNLKQLQNAKKALDDSSYEIASGIAEMTSQLGVNISGTSYQSQLDNIKLRAKSFSDTSYAKIKESQELIEKNKSTVESSYKVVLEKIEVETDPNVLQELHAQKIQLEQTMESLTIELANIDASKQKLDLEINTINNGIKTLQVGIIAYNDAQDSYNTGYNELERLQNEALAQFDDSQKEIDDALETIENSSRGKAYIFERKDVLVGYSEFYQDSDRIEAIGRVFPLIFFGVSVLVTLSTISRMIDESRSQIGVYKALGYSSLYASSKYIYFALLSWLIGSIMGLMIGFYLIPNLIYNAYRIMYQTPDLMTGFVGSYASLPLMISFICSVGVASYKSMKTSRQKTSDLLRPVAPKKGQRIILERVGFIWNRLSFLYKVSFRNLFRNRSRFLMTILGIGGCAGLLITAFGLNHSIYSIIDKQFGEVIQYDGTVLHDNADFDTSVFDSSITLSSIAGKSQENDVVIMAVNEGANLNDFITLQNRKTKEPLVISTESIIISEKLAILNDLSIDDYLDLDINGQDISFRVGGIAENYVMHYVYMSKSLYQEKTGETPQNTMTLFKTSGNHQEIAEQVLANDKVYSISFLDDISNSYADMMSNFDIVIYVIMGAAFILELIVLLNLISMNLSEREKELATIKVLGFYPNEMAQYVLRENVILTLLSMAFGLLFGVFLHKYVVLKAELNFVMFNRELLVSSVLTAIGITIILSLVINLVMSKRTNNVNMSEALKTFDE